MKNHKKVAGLVIAFLLLGMFSFLTFFSCKNPLLTEIEDTVDIVVTPPSVASIYPLSSAKNIPVNLENISVTFTKDIDSASVTSKTFIIADNSGAVVSGLYAVSNDTITFTPNSTLLYDTVYSVTIDGVLDVDGNSLTEAYTWNFETGLAPDETPPAGISLSINSGDEWAVSSTVELSIEAQDDYGVAQMNISNSNSFSDSGWTTYSESYTWTLPSGEGYKTVYVKFKDGAGNTSSSAVSDGIKIDNTVPVVESFLVNGGKSATNSETVDLSITASDADGSSGVTHFRYRFENEDWQAWQELTSGTGSVESLLLNVSLGENQTLECQAVDLAGNASAVVSQSIVYENTPPSIMNVSWDDDPVFPYNASLIRIIFDEEMDPSSFNETNYKLQKAADLSAVKGMISLSEGNEITNSSAELWGLELAPNTEYKVTLDTTVKDIAGNALSGSVRTWFFSTGDAVDSSPPDGTVILSDPDGTGPIIVKILPSGSTATNDALINIDLSKITDDYNIPYGMKFWGDNSGGEAYFEQNASWESWSDTRTWTLSAGAGVKYVLYKFMDSAGNETETPGQLKIILDDNTDLPVISDVVIENGVTHINSTDRIVSVNIGASDEYSGISQMAISHDQVFEESEWIDWSPLTEDWILPDEDKEHIFYIQVRDYLGQESGIFQFGDLSYPSIILDRTPPVLDFTADLILTNDEVHLTAADYYTITEDYGIGAYSWEKLSGLGTLYFNDEASDLTPGDGKNEAEPYLEAGAEDTYFIRLTVTDKAGNSAWDTIPMTWDETAPAAPLSVTVPDYSVTGQPTWDWDTVAEADYYKVSYTSGFSSSEDTESSDFTPNTALLDGEHTLYVRSYDYAGNYSTGLVYDTVFVDTLPPVISNQGQQFIANEASFGEAGIDYTGGDGSVTDPGTPGTDSSDLDPDSYQWSLVSGPAEGIVTFTPDDELAATVSANINGIYQIKLSAADRAGNTSSANFTLLRDITPPGAPVVTGPDLTPSQYPTWYWSSGGGGIGVYRYSLDSGTWSGEVTDTSWGPESGTDDPLENKADHILEVQERDAAGNWSAAGSKMIHVDTDATTPPQITLGDGEPALRNVTTVTWDLLSGLGNASYEFRYNINNGEWIEVSSTPLPGSPPAYSLVPDASPLYPFTNDGTYTLYVQEALDTAGNWQTDMTGVHTITVDTTPPGKPDLTGTGLPISGEDRTAGSDTTPTWSWKSGGGGNGQYLYSFKGGDWTPTSSTSFTPASQTDGTYAFAIKELDDAGNESPAAYHSITVDTAAPVVNSVTLAGTTRDDDTFNKYTRSTTVTVTVDADVTGESADVTIEYDDYNPSGVWVPAADPYQTNPSFTTTLSPTNGTKYVKVRLVDEAGNIASYKYDTIILDTNPPKPGFFLNNDAPATPSLRAYLTLSADDTYSDPSQIQVLQNYNKVDYTWKSYSTSMLSDFSFTDSAGSKTAAVKFRDAAGNETSWIEDDIELEVPEPIYAYKGFYSTGATRVYYDPVTEPEGKNDTLYQIYSMDTQYSPEAPGHPNNDGKADYHDETISTVYCNVKIKPGDLRYFYVRAYNADTGGWGPYSGGSVLGFSSNITIIYDDKDDKVEGYKDRDRAIALKDLLEDRQDITLDKYIEGTMPPWTVTLLPEDLIENAVDRDSNIIYGDPVIFTPGTTFSTLNIYDGKVLNIAAGGRGIVGMGNPASDFFYRVTENWKIWGLEGTSPTAIDSAMTLKALKTGKTRPEETSEGIWYTPLFYTVLYEKYRNVSQTAEFFTVDTGRRGVYLKGGENPVDGYIYAGDPNYPDYFPTVRQGRFLYFGFLEVPDVTVISEVFFINLIARMDDFK